VSKKTEGRLVTAPRLLISGSKVRVLDGPILFLLPLCYRSPACYSRPTRLYLHSAPSEEKQKGFLGGQPCLSRAGSHEP